MAEKQWQKGARQRFKEKSASKNFKVPQGETIFRVLPNMTSAEKYGPYKEYKMHSKIGPNKRYMRCGKSFDGKTGSCFLCDELLPKLEKSSKASAQQAAVDLAPAEKFAVQIVYQDNETGKWIGPTLWEISSQQTTRELLGIFARPDRDYTDPKRGKNFLITRKGTGMMDTKYGGVQIDDEPSALPAELLAKGKKFADLLRKYDGDKMKAAYYGHEQDKDDDVDAAEKATPEDEVTEETTEEEAPAPAPKKKKAAPPPVEEEEVETEVAEETEEVETDLGTEEDGEQSEEELTEESEDAPPAEEEFEEVDEPAPPKKAAAKPVGKKAAPPPPVEEEEETETEEVAEEEFEELEEETPPPPPKKKPAPAPAPAKKPAPAPAKKPAPPPAKKPVRR